MCVRPRRAFAGGREPASYACRKVRGPEGSGGAPAGSYGFFPGVNAITAPRTTSPIPTAMPGGNHEPTLAATVIIPIMMTTIRAALILMKRAQLRRQRLPLHFAGRGLRFSCKPYAAVAATRSLDSRSPESGIDNLTDGMGTADRSCAAANLKGGVLKVSIPERAEFRPAQGGGPERSS